jgi:hypothetical protein
MLLLSISVSVNAQNQLAPSVQTDKEAIRKSTGAPERSEYSSDAEYSAAKTEWIAKNPDAYQRIVSTGTAPSKSKTGPADRKEEETSHP